MTTMQLHPRSLLVGLAIGGVVLFSMAQSTAPTYATVRMQYMPHPRDMLRIVQGTPFVVPPGKVFVLTGLGVGNTTQPFEEAALKVNGVVELSSSHGGNVSGFGDRLASMTRVPSGFSVSAGSTIEVESTGGWAGQQNGRAVGYVVDAQVGSNPVPVRVEYVPHPSDLIQLPEGSPFVVPAGKVLVVTGLGVADAGATGNGYIAALSLNGQSELCVQKYNFDYALEGLTSSISDVPPCFSVPAGTSVAVTSLSPPLLGRAWGYLADQ